ncbi:DNA replication complex GINS protein PSF1-like isoform X1 [Artemia franciscana]|uniref:DNA replication complex GINS protein PSF1-like isoform X1 n=1 Tax=Artemia franciscana TaxID=6661 RepID=UPI0032DBC558
MLRMNFVQDLIRPHTSIPPFNDDGVRQLLDEMESLYRENIRDSVELTEYYPTVLIRHAYLERRKRYLLSYLKNRLDEISLIRWQFGSILPSNIKTQLCEPEILWFNKYSKALSQYMKSVGDGTGLDLTQNQQPPKSPYIQVKVLEDIGEVQNEYDETIVLKPGTIHYLPKSLCEQFIHEGMMEHIPIV